MRLSEHYLNLLEKLSYSEVMVPQRVYINQISDHLFCTKRHAKHILKQLVEKQWVTWEVTPGRGNVSTLTFLLTADEIKVEIAKQLVLEGNYKKALQQMELVETQHKVVFHEWLNRQVGFTIETINQKELDVLRYPFYKCITNLDPANLFSRHDAHIVNQIFDTLLKYNPATQELKANLAFHWESMEQGKVWCFHLRKGVMFHNGRELTAEDVVYTFNRLRTMNQPHQDYTIYEMIQKIEIINKTVIQFVLDEANVLFPYYVAQYQTSILPNELFTKDPNAFLTSPIGTGPFKIAKHDDSSLILDAFNAYFGYRPHLDRIEIITLPELYPNQNELINHRFNLGDNKQKENWQKINRVEEGACYFTFNLNKKGIQQNADFRASLVHALNVKEIANDLEVESYKPAYSFFTSISETVKYDTFNPKLAQKLLKLSGYDGELINIYATQLRPGANHEEEALWLQSQWNRIGVKTEVKVIAIEELSNPCILQQAHIVVAGVSLSENVTLSLMKSYQIPTAFIVNMVGTEMGDVIEEKLNFLKRNEKSNRHLEILFEIENVLKNHYMLTFLHHRSHCVYVNVGSSLEGVEMTNYGRINYQKLWFNAVNSSEK